MSALDSVILLLADGFVAVGRVLRGLRRPSGAEVRSQAHVDALNALEDSQDGLEPGDLTAFGLKWPTKADKDRAFGELKDSLDRITAAERGELARPTLDSLLDAYWSAQSPEVETQALEDLRKYYPEHPWTEDFWAQEPLAHGTSGECPTDGPSCGCGRSAAVTPPAADNTTDCGCGSGTKCPDPITCPDAVTAAMAEDTAAADGTDLYDAIVALFDYHDITRNLTADYLWRCGGCNWKGNQRREHTLHRLALVADMKNATHRIQEQLGGAS